jgi:hypothetical protein
MPTLNVVIQVNGRPLRRTYVEHLVFGVVQDLYLTDDDGRIRDKTGNLGINSFTPTADIRILCQNTVVRMLNGASANIAVDQTKNISDGSTVNLNTNSEQDDHYAILNRCLLTYDVVFRQFRPFADLSHPDFPLGKAVSLKATKNQKKRIEVSYPSGFPLGDLAFCEPKSSSTGFPLVHIRKRPGPGNPMGDGRLFGEPDNRPPNSPLPRRPTLIPAELAHGLHFSLFSSAGRQAIQNDYIGWIVTDIANGGGGTHGMGVRTSPRVAYIEALDHFSSRFAEFVRVQVQGGSSTLLSPQPMTPQIRQDFLADELSSTPVSSPAVASLDAGGNIVPNPAFAGSDDEGSVYGCIFVDFARRVGLRTAVNAYLRSAASGATSFGQYRTWIATHRQQHLAALNAAQSTWNL